MTQYSRRIKKKSTLVSVFEKLWIHHRVDGEAVSLTKNLLIQKYPDTPPQYTMMGGGGGGGGALEYKQRLLHRKCALLRIGKRTNWRGERIRFLIRFNE